MQNENANSKVEAVSAAIVSNINQRCQCGLSHKNITDGVFRCFSSSPQAVTFRAILYGTAKASSSEIISLIEEWISIDVTIPVLSVLINIDSRCTATISSFDDGECQLNSKPPRNGNVLVIIGGSVSAVLLVLVLVCVTIIIMVLLLLWFRKRHQVYLKHSRYDNVNIMYEISIKRKDREGL